jgi:hypothetical protein
MAVKPRPEPREPLAIEEIAQRQIHGFNVATHGRVQKPVEKIERPHEPNFGGVVINRLE